jgi:hypothetical protein
MQIISCFRCIFKYYLTAFLLIQYFMSRCTEYIKVQVLTKTRIISFHSFIWVLRALSRELDILEFIAYRHDYENDKPTTRGRHFLIVDEHKKLIINSIKANHRITRQRIVNYPIKTCDPTPPF